MEVAATALKGYWVSKHQMLNSRSEWLRCLDFDTLIKRSRAMIGIMALGGRMIYDTQEAIHSN